MTNRETIYSKTGIFHFLIFTLLLCSSGVHAAVIVFTDRSLWQATASGNFIIEDFNTLASSSAIGSRLYLASGIIITPESGTKTRISSFPFSKIGEGQALQTFESLQIQYTGANVRGYGFEYADLDWGGATLSFGDFSIDLPKTTDADVSISSGDFAFFGFYADHPEDFDSGQFSLTINGYEGYALDNLTAVSSVPTPGGLTLFLSGLIGLVIVRKPKPYHSLPSRRDSAIMSK